jgi:hypothetical protein
MGQQQLLLLVLATVIVGLATVAGIQAFEQGQNRANQDALTQQAVKVASDIQAKVKEPSQFGGLDGDLSSADVSSSGNITLSGLGYNTTNNSDDMSGSGYETSSGECQLTTNNSNVAVQCESDQASVIVEVQTLNPKGIVTVSQSIKS